MTKEQAIALLHSCGLISDQQRVMASEQCPIHANWGRAEYILFSSWYPGASWDPGFWFEPETHRKTLKATIRALDEALLRAGDESGSYKCILVRKDGKMFSPEIKSISLVAV